jgi:phosphonate transport system permease protein
VFKYEAGWELWFFTLESPFYGKSFLDLAYLATIGDRVDPERMNAAYMVEEFWTNRMWRHGDVMWAIFETILMAFLGTMTAAIVSLPLGFLAASNFMPLSPVRFALRRVFDFIRGVDGLIWTIILSRAFGPGPMTGAIAIAITDAGSFGKTFSEALENIDEKQVEGVVFPGKKSKKKSTYHGKKKRK